MKSASQLALRRRLAQVAAEQSLDLHRPAEARAAAQAVCASLWGRCTKQTVHEAARVLRHVLPVALDRHHGA